MLEASSNGRNGGLLAEMICCLVGWLTHVGDALGIETDLWLLSELIRV